MVYTDAVSRREKDPTTPLGRWVRDVRKDAGLTQARFGERIGVHEKTVTAYEGGTYGLGREVVELIMKRFPKAPHPPSAIPPDGAATLVAQAQHASVEPSPQSTAQIMVSKQANVGSLMAALEAWAASLKIPNPIDDSEFAHAITAAWLEYEKRSKALSKR